MPDLSTFHFAPFFLAVYLGSSGVRKGSLSPSGGLADFIVGFAMMAVRLRVFGVSLIAFYLVGSKATKLGKERKAKLEEGHQAAVRSCFLRSRLRPGRHASRILLRTVVKKQSVPYRMI